MPPDDQMPPEFLMFFDIADSLDLTPAQQQYMVDVFYTAREKGVNIKKDSLLKHMRHTKLTNTKL
jgi:Spy/CpxP family protein refolding chaperone